MTLELAALSLVIAVVLGVPTGVISAVRQDTPLDYVLRVFSLAGLSMPSFWLGMVIILGLVAWFGWIPPVTYVRPGENFPLHAVQFLLPALAVGYRSSALIMRITRSSLLEVLREDYVRTAWAKGQSKRIVIWRHALKNAVLPVVTVIGIEFAFLIGGLVVTETVFNLPGLARFLVQAILWRDYPIVQNLVMIIATVVIVVQSARRHALRRPRPAGPLCQLSSSSRRTALASRPRRGPRPARGPCSRGSAGRSPSARPAA